jgi:EH domain-containing protein 1
MYRDNYITALRTELLEMVSEQLTPVAMRYGYSEVPLETNIKWRPRSWCWATIRRGNPP